jgi:hypothetical protein
LSKIQGPFEGLDKKKNIIFKEFKVLERVFPGFKVGTEPPRYKPAKNVGVNCR